MKNIAIQEGLTPVKQYLSQQGYQVQTFDKRENFNLKQFDAVILTGLDENQLGTDNTNTKAPIIEARGLTPQQIQTEIEQRTGIY